MGTVEIKRDAVRRRQWQDEEERKKEAELRQAMEIPKEFCPAPEKP